MVGRTEVSTVAFMIFSAHVTVRGEDRTHILVTMAWRATSSCSFGSLLMMASPYA